MTKENTTERLIDVREVSGMVHMHRSTIFRRMKSGDFPRSVKLGCSLRWRQSDILAWIAALEPAK